MRPSFALVVLLLTLPASAYCEDIPPPTRGVQSDAPSALPGPSPTTAYIATPSNSVRAVAALEAPVSESLRQLETAADPQSTPPAAAQTSIPAAQKPPTPGRFQRFMASTSCASPGGVSTGTNSLENYRISLLPRINGCPYDQPSRHDLLKDYATDTYGPFALARTTIRSLYSQARQRPQGWGQDWPGYGQRFGSAAAITAINGNVRLGMELLFHEDLRYLPCHGCSVKSKIENALLSEITARHNQDGRRFFTLTPTIADFSGPIISHTIWYPGASSGPLQGVVSARTVFATRIGVHLFQEFVFERFHKDQK
jgi:hypothetical protein